MSHRSFFLSVTVSILFLSVAARSQETAPTRGLDESAAVALRKKAIELLESVAGQVDSLHSAENRARIGSNVAELLWNHDERRSRALFSAVEQDIRLGFNDTDSNEAAHFHTLLVFAKLRSDTLGRIARHDLELALEFLRATRPNPDVRLPPQLHGGEKSLESRLASQIAAKNPQLALKLGRQSLAKGFSYDLLSVLTQLQPKDKDAWLSFYREIVDKLKGANLEQDPAATEFALYLARSFEPPEADEQVYRELIGVLVASAFANGCADVTADYAPRICVDVGALFPRIEKYFAQSAASLKRWVGDGQNYHGPTMSAHMQEVIANGTVDEILALTGRDPYLDRQVLWAAMNKAEASGDIARARRIAAETTDEGQRRYMLAQIDRNEMSRSVNQEKLAAIQQQLSRFRSNDQRIQYLLQQAAQIGGNDRKVALGFLNQAGQLIDLAKPGRAQLQGHLALSMLYCSLGSNRGFTIMESLMPRLNELVTAASVLDGVENNYFRDGEWNMTGQGVLGSLLTHLAHNAGCFAVLDFDRSVTLARQFDRPELRLMAQLRLAQGVLTKQPNALRRLE
ncbi:MAG TPA: hypothetical protein VEW46_04145 [Pyrinomonadaceae bacterium]|nr:hypothetical protein [Pyrinomonadaceae bacterium]